MDRIKRCPSHTTDDKGRDRRCDLIEGHPGNHLSRARISEKIGALLWCFIKRKEYAMDHIKIKAGPSREELAAAVQIMGHDIGFNGCIVPFWAKDLAVDLYKKGWRRYERLDERDQKERWAEAMVRDLNGLRPGTICPKSTWVLNLGIRLVQSGWSKE
jgi:hypothetical protein